MPNYKQLDSDAFEDAYKNALRDIYEKLFQGLLLAKSDPERQAAVQHAAAGIKQSRQILEECLTLSAAT
jgi:hypothetical protein